MVDKRKVSDAILELEQKVSNLAAFVQNTDTNVKIILDRLNTLVKTTNKPPTPKQQSFVPVEAEPNQTLVASESFEPVFDENGDRELIEEVVHKGSRRTSRVQQPTNPTKLSVSQQILFNDGKPAVLAQVEILDTNGKTVKQTRTNVSGRWIAPLVPGVYSVHVLKRAEGNKKPLTLDYSIEIPVGEGPLQLDTLNLPK